MAAVPPEDPEDWSDEEWLAWLEATDAEAAATPDRPVTVAAQFARSAAGSTLGAAMKGLHRAIYGAHDDEIAIVADASGDPPGPEGIDVHLDPEDPEKSTVVVKRPAEVEERPLP